MQKTATVEYSSKLLVQFLSRTYFDIRAGKGTSPEGSNDETHVLFSVPDIHCQGCVETIRAGPLLEHGVTAAEGDAQAKTVIVRYRTSVTSPERIETVIAGLGYRVASKEAA